MAMDLIDLHTVVAGVSSVSGALVTMIASKNLEFRAASYWTGDFAINSCWLRMSLCNRSLDPCPIGPYTIYAFNHSRCRAYRSTFDRRQGHVQICFDGVTSYHLRSTYIPNHTQYRPYTYPYAIMCARLQSLSGHSTIYICEENFVTSRTKLSCFPVRVGLHLAHRLAMGVEHLPTPHHAVHHRRPLLLNRLALLPFEFLLSSFVEESFTLLHSYERRSLWWSHFSDILSPISVQIFSLPI
jgi:hypothetical protein